MGTSLDRKLWRDLWIMKGQALAIALVIVSGIATYIMSVSTMDALRATQATFYRDYRFAEVFASLKRAPESLAGRLAEIPGVAQVETRVVAEVRLEVSNYPHPVTGRLISVPEEGQSKLNRLYLNSGRLVAPGRNDEVVISGAFAEAHRFKPGDTLGAVINGRHRKLKIVGIVLSPECIFQIKPGGLFPDFERYGLLWMARPALAAAYQMDGAFNDLAMTLWPGARIEDVLPRLDTRLEPYGGLGAYGRRDHVSHRYLSEEFRQLANMSFFFPVIFLGVAAFLLNIVTNRLVATQRDQVAVLKAFGYTNMAIGWHYAQMILVIVVLGSAGGLVAGFWLGRNLSELYMQFYRFPYLLYRLEPSAAATGILVSLSAAALGTVLAVRRAALLPPAEAMRPEPPARYRETILERLGFQRFLAPPTRMIVRNLERQAIKSLLAILGLSLAGAIVVLAGFFEDSTDFMVELQFGLSQREDLSVTMVEPTSAASLAELASLPGVKYTQPFRTVPARIRSGHKTHRTVIQGVAPEGDLYRLLDQDFRPRALPPQGLVLTDFLGQMLGVRPGDRVIVEVLEGSRPVREVPVVDLITQYVGVSGFMDLAALNRFMGEGQVISGAYLAVESDAFEGVTRALQRRPRVAGIEARRDAIANFRKSMSQQALIFTSIITILAATIALGVVYNNARIALSERSRELASLRVLGFTRREIAYILLGELAILTLISLPGGFVAGHLFSAYLVSMFETELYRVPLVIDSRTYAFTATVILVSAIVSGLVVARRLARLDLVAVLKTRE